MKKEWQTKKLGELVEVQNGYAFSSKDYSDSGHFVMRIGNVQNGYISMADPKFIKLPADGSLRRFVLSEGDILVSLTGNVGRVGLIQEEHLPAALNQRVARITVRKDSPINRDLLLFFLCSDWFREELTGAGHGAAQQNVSTKDIIEISIPVPPLAEQQRIVGLLDEVFANLATAQAHAERNNQNARALFESHIQSVFTQHGKGWVEKNLGDLCQIKTGKKDVNEGNPEGKYPFFTCAAAHTYSDNYSFDTEALLVAGNGNVGQVSYYSGKFEAYQRTYVLFSFKDVTAKYLFRVLDKRLSATVSKKKLGNTMPYIKIGMLTDFVVPVPPPNEQETIAANLDEVAEETQRLATLYEGKLAALAELKKSLLHQAFTGNL